LFVILKRTIAQYPGRVEKAIASIFALRSLLIAIRGSAPFWNALTTVASLIAHLYLMGRVVQSWYLWIAIDMIYVLLYASRQLY